MTKSHRLHLIAPAITLLALAALACAFSGSGSIPVSEPKAAIAPISLGSDLTAINLCQAIPKEDMEAVMGRKLVSAPKSFDYYQTSGASGCQYDGGKDANRDAYYSYVVLTPIEAYNTQPLHLQTEVSGLGQSAYFNNGADTRQLWVKVNDQVAFVVANGDVENEAGQKAIAQLVLAAIK